MAARKTPEAVVEQMTIGFCADGIVDEYGAGRSWRGLASCNEIGPGPADAIFHHVGDEGAEHQADEETKNGDVTFMPARFGANGPAKEERQRDTAGIEEEPACEVSAIDGRRRRKHTNAHSLDLGVGIL